MPCRSERGSSGEENSAGKRTLRALFNRSQVLLREHTFQFAGIRAAEDWLSPTPVSRVTEQRKELQLR